MVIGTLILVDGNSYLFRAFHAIKEMTRSDGRPTGAVFGFLASLDLIERTVPDSTLVSVFDTPEATFRSEIDAAYKANREPCPVELQEQFPIVKEVLDALGIPRFEQPGFEADDVIGTIGRWWEERGGTVTIASGDKDLLQLVTEKVSVLRTHLSRTKTYDPSAVEEKYQVRPECLADVLALMGDSVDNIPGVPGIGEKTAGSLVAEFANLEGIYERIEDVKGPKRRASLKEHRERVFQSRLLATIRTDVSLDLSEETLSRRSPDAAALYKLFSELEFRNRAAYWKKSAGVDETPTNYEAIASLERLRDVVNDLDPHAVLAFDTETTSLDTQRAELVGISFSQKSGEGYYVPVGHTGMNNLDQEAVLETLRPWLEDPDRRLVAHNLKYDAHILARYGVEVTGSDDTLLMSQLADPDIGSHGLKDLALRLLQMPMTEYGEVAGRGKAAKTFDLLDAADVFEYAAADADATLRLHQYYRPRLSERGVEELYETIELPLVSVLRRMEAFGVLVDRDALARQSEELSHEIDELESVIHEEAGREFNVNSPAQLATVLFDEMGVEPPGRKRTTRADVLERLAARGVSICRSILKYRQCAKLKSTYVDALPGLISPVDERVHTSYHQASVNTGRLSSSNPNLQNIPVRSAMGKRVRSAFIAPEGKCLLSADYSQIELRILGVLSKDPGLLDAFERGEDIHTQTATQIFGVLPLEVDDAMRSKAKAVNFGLNYGMTAHGLAERLKISRVEAQDYIDAFFTNFPNVRAYLDSVVEEGREAGFVRTILRRRVPTRGLGDQNRMRREAARRAAINAPVQGSAADLMKIAMVRVDEWIQAEHPPVVPIMTVHDELLFEVEKGAEMQMASEIRKRMESALDLGIPTPVDVSTGSNWSEL